MIFVTLGTQDKSFHRLLKALDTLLSDGIIKDEIIVQAGTTRFSSPFMKVMDFMDMKTFESTMEQCDLLITHGGVGSILTGLKRHKKVLAVARLQEFDEHENNHQIEIIQRFSDMGYVKGCCNVDDLKDCLNGLQDFKPVAFHSQNEDFCTMIQKLIQD